MFLLYGKNPKALLLADVEGDAGGVGISATDVGRNQYARFGCLLCADIQCQQY